MSLEGINVKKLTPMLRHWLSIRQKFDEDYLIAYS